VNWHYKNPTLRVGLVQSGPRDHLIENLRSRHGIAEKLLNWHQTIILHSLWFDSTGAQTHDLPHSKRAR
jgi:hypothetical protein